MPRRHRRDPDAFPTPEVPLARADAPAWAGLAGHDVRSVGSTRAYRCPGCDHLVRSGTWHLVVVPLDAPEERRHWHTACWRRELRRIAPPPG
jgi:hypothetical protein